MNDLTQFVHHDVSSLKAPKHMASTDELHGRQPRVKRRNGEEVLDMLLYRCDIYVDGQTNDMISQIGGLLNENIF